jgi:hypothetical protein
VAVLQAERGKFQDAGETLDKVADNDKDQVYVRFVNDVVKDVNKPKDPNANAMLLEGLIKFADRIKSPGTRANALMVIATSPFQEGHDPGPLFEKIKNAALEADSEAKRKAESQPQRPQNDNSELRKEEAELYSIRVKADLIAEKKRLAELEKQETDRSWYWVPLVTAFTGLGAAVVMVVKAGLEEVGKSVVGQFMKTKES